MIIIVEGFDKVKQVADVMNTIYGYKTIDMSKVNMLEDYLLIMRDNPDCIIYNTWLKKNIDYMSVNDDFKLPFDNNEQMLLNSYVKEHNGYAYYITNPNQETLTAKYGDKAVKAYNIEMQTLKMFMPVIAKNEEDL